MLPGYFKSIKIYCHSEMYWNLTKPYFRYEVGKWYSAKVNGEEIYWCGTKVNGEEIYIFENCDVALDKTGFNKYFCTEEEFREKQINKIL